MSRDVIMPALGMTQDTGLIVAWHKQPGEAVSAGDVLMEVETDKTTMEVPADHDGFVAAIYAEAGEAVPVGQVIAVISDDRPDHPVRRSIESKKTETTDVDTPAESVAEKVPASSADISPAPQVITASGDGRILASPKAKRMARELGLDLKRLVNLGHPQPYHVSDVETLRALPQEAAAPAAFAGTSDLGQIAAKVKAKAFDAFLERMRTDGEVELQPHQALVSFAAASLREAIPVNGELAIDISTIPHPAARYVDPDLQRLSTVEAVAASGDPALIIRDTTGTFITGMRIGTAEAPVLTIARRKRSFVLTLEFSAEQMSADQ